MVVLLLSTALTATVLSCGFGLQPYVVELWSSSMYVNDVAVSDDGNYIAVTNETGLYFFSAYDPNPIWWFEGQEGFVSVEISADGNYVVAGYGPGYIAYFADALSLSGSVADATWWSIDLGAGILRLMLDMSSDGNYVVAYTRAKADGYYVAYVYYFADCTSRSGVDQTPTWFNSTRDCFARIVDMSRNGRYVAVGGSIGSSEFVAFYKDADTKSGPVTPDWYKYVEERVVNLIVSDDGYAVAALILRTTFYYWANAKALTGTPEATWSGNGVFYSLGMSSDGDRVVAGFHSGYDQSIYFWSGARSLTGLPKETWQTLHVNALTVTISEDGNTIVAIITRDDITYSLVFLTPDGSVIDEFPSPSLELGVIMSMSEDGGIVAIGTGPESLHVFKLIKPPVGGIVLPTLPIAPIAVLAAISIVAVMVTKAWLHK